MSAQIVERLNSWWPFSDPIRFRLQKNIILIVLHEDTVECIGIIRGIKVTLFGTPYNSIIRSHIIRVYGASLAPMDLSFDNLFDTPTRYKSDFAQRCATPTTSHD
jgi:hypothetical protein